MANKVYSKQEIIDLISAVEDGKAAILSHFGDKQYDDGYYIEWALNYYWYVDGDEAGKQLTLSPDPFSEENVKNENADIFSGEILRNIRRGEHFTMILINDGCGHRNWLFLDNEKESIIDF